MSKHVFPALVDPFGLKESDGYFWLKGNLHSHSTNSDGVVSPQERVDGYVAKGYDFISVTDHHVITPIDTLHAPQNVVLIQGVELHPDNPFGGLLYHFLALNIKEPIDARKMPPQHVIDEVKRQGGQVWLAHPYWSNINILRDAMPLRGLSGIEVLNGACHGTAREDSSVHWDDWMNLTRQIIPAIGTDDSHSAPDHPRPDTFLGWTWVRVKERTPAAILDALEHGASYVSSGPVIHELQLSLSPNSKPDTPIVRVRLRSSPAIRICVVGNHVGEDYGRLLPAPFEEAEFDLTRTYKHVRFVVYAADGTKAWSNPYDLTSLGVF